MSTRDRLTLTCTCEGSMPIDAGALERSGCGRIEATVDQLCRADLKHFRAALASGLPVTVACIQEQALFEEIAEEAGGAELAFANIRETGGWSEQAKRSGPKAAALIAAAAEIATPFEVVSMESKGVALVLGSGDAAVVAARALADTLDITVLVTPGSDVTPPSRVTFPILQGRVSRAIGHLGAFELTVDAYAAPAPSSRRRLVFEAGRDGALSRPDLIIDLTGGQALFAAGDLRPGYYRADPGDPAAVARLIGQASHMVGTFDKPRYINFSADLCAHSRNRKIGCTRCLDLCPAGAIAPAGEAVAIDAEICAGCGQCAAACPTGAASYALPTAESLARRLRAALRAWYGAGAAVAPVILLHDDEHGAALIDASARFGRGLPSNIVPILVNEVTQTGPELIASAFAWGAGGVRLLSRERPRHDITGLHGTLALMAEILAGTGHRPEAVALIQTDDPDGLEDALYGIAPPAPASRSSFLPPEDKRGLLTAAMLELNRHAPAPANSIPLPKGAPFGAVILDVQACTLCHACVGVCPTGALTDNPDLPSLRFSESACVQCGLCAATCPEAAITLAPQLDFAAWESPKRSLKEEAPYACTGCGKPFGTRSGIERIQARLAGHWMFAGPEGEARARILTMCEDCRVAAVVNEGFDPHDATTRKVRTRDDYLA